VITYPLVFLEPLIGSLRFKDHDPGFIPIAILTPLGDYLLN
jgi:hypothetical protein